MKQIRLSNKNEKAILELLRDCGLNLLTVPKAANLAVEVGLPKIRKLFVKGIRKCPERQ